MARASKEVHCSVREINGPSVHQSESLFGIELRIERDGEMYLTELYRNREKLDTRCQELHDLLVAKGWR